MTSFLSWFLLRVLWLTLRGLLACSPALRQPFVQTLSRDAFTIVFGRTGRLSGCAAGSSAHEYGEAFDMVTSPMDALADVGYTWQQWGGAWNPGDAVHFELPGASERAKQKGLESPWYVDLAAGIPLSIPLSIVLAFLGIPRANASTSLRSRLPTSGSWR